MRPKKRKSNIVVTGPRRVTRQQVRLNGSPTPQACPHLPRGSLASPSCFRKNANTFPRAAQRIRGRKVNEEQETVMIVSDESEHESTDEYLPVQSIVNQLYREANLPKKLADSSNDPSPQSDSDEDSQHISDSPSDFEAELATYTRRPANIRSNAGTTGNALRHCGATTSNVDGAVRVGNSSNSRIIDDVRRNLDIPFAAFFRENNSAENVPRNSAGNGNGTMSREEPTTASATAVERPLESTRNLTRTRSFGLTELISMYDSESGMDEVQSPAVGTVHGYVVKQEFVSILRRIMDKYGDIAADYNMESCRSRSSSLETICHMIQIFQGKRFNEIPLSEITSSLSQVRDFRKIGMTVEWFEKRLEYMEAAKRIIKESSSLKEEKNKYAALVKELQTKLVDQKTQLNDCRTQSVILNDSINEQMKQLTFLKAKAQELQMSEKSTTEDLEKAQENARRLNQITSDGIRKVKFFLEHPLVDDLL